MSSRGEETNPARDPARSLILPGGKVDADAVRLTIGEVSTDGEEAESEGLCRVTFRLSRELDKRLDKYLTDRIPFMSRTALQRLIDESRHPVTLNVLEEAAGDDQALLDLAGLLWIAEPLRTEGEVLDGVLHRAENCLFTLRSMAIVNRIREVAQETLYAQQAGDHQLVEKLTFEHLDLERIHRHLLSKIAET